MIYEKDSKLGNQIKRKIQNGVHPLFSNLYLLLCSLIRVRDAWNIIRGGALIFQASALISLAYTAFKIPLPFLSLSLLPPAPSLVYRCVSILFNFIWLQSLDGFHPLYVVNYYFPKRQISLEFSPFIPPFFPQLCEKPSPARHRTFHSFIPIVKRCNLAR